MMFSRIYKSIIILDLDMHAHTKMIELHRSYYTLYVAMQEWLTSKKEKVVYFRLC